jgi:biotin carboxylase
MKISIIIHTNTGFGMRWKELYNPSLHKMVMIATPQAIKSFNRNDEIYFEKIMVVNDSSFASLLLSVKNVLTELSVDDITQVRLASCDEFALRDVALIRENLGIEGNMFNQVEAFTNKVRMKQRIQNSVRVPNFLPFQSHRYLTEHKDYIDSIVETLNFPMIGKPVDSAGSENVMKIHNIEELAQWCELNKDNSNFELEEFIDGELYQCDSVIVDGQIIHVQACKYNTPVMNFIKGYPLGSIVVEKETSISQKLFAFNEAALNAFKPLPTGVTHMEIFIDNKNNECVFLECAARAPGAYTCPAYDIYLGIHHETLQCQIELDLPYSIETKNGQFAAWVWYPNKEGELIEIKEPATDCEYKFARMHEKGGIIKKPTKQRERAAAILFWDQSYEKLQNEFDKLCGMDLVIVKPPTQSPSACSSFFDSMRVKATDIDCDSEKKNNQANVQLANYSINT